MVGADEELVGQALYRRMSLVCDRERCSERRSEMTECCCDVPGRSSAGCAAEIENQKWYEGLQGRVVDVAVPLVSRRVVEARDVYAMRCAAHVDVCACHDTDFHKISAFWSALRFDVQVQ